MVVVGNNRISKVYTKRTRMLFSPKHTVTRHPEDRGDPSLVLQSASGWDEPVKSDVKECRAALAKAYPDRMIFADTAEGLVPIWEPRPA